MDVSSTILDRDSAASLAVRFTTLVDSGAAVLHVRTAEQSRALVELRRTILQDQGEYNEWNCADGFRQFTIQNYQDHSQKGDGQTDFNGAFLHPMNIVRDKTVSKGADSGAIKYFVFVNPPVFMDGNPFAAQLVTMYSTILPSCNICIVIVTPDQPLPATIEDKIMTVDLPPPGLKELQSSLVALVEHGKADFATPAELTEDDIRRICYVGAGMSLQEFETYVALAMTEAARNGQDELTVEALVSGVSQGKTEIVNRSDLLELYPAESMDSIGGLENLKDWVSKRANCYSDEARAFGIEPPKGVVLVGVPGSGKSQVAKAVAHTLGVPLVRLDFGKVFNSFIGSSEKRIRDALKAVESMAPVVLFCDEIDKGLGGAGGSGDSGTSSRVLGSFLTWLQECKYPVFTMVTANNVTGLPPELLRKGRFDEIFSTTMPTPKERREILAIHLRKRGRDIADFASKDVTRIVEASQNYVGAEIEAAIKGALVDAFNQGQELTADDIIATLRAMVPMSRSFATQIEGMKQWAANNATPASREDTAINSHGQEVPSERVSPRRRTASRREV